MEDRVKNHVEEELFSVTGEEVREKLAAKAEEVREDMEGLRLEVREAVSEFTEDLKEKLVSPEVLEAIGTIQYLVGNSPYKDSSLTPPENVRQLAGDRLPSDARLQP